MKNRYLVTKSFMKKQVKLLLCHSQIRLAIMMILTFDQKSYAHITLFPTGVDMMLWGMSREVSKTKSCLYYDHLFATGRIHKGALGCTSAWSAGTISAALPHACMAP